MPREKKKLGAWFPKASVIKGCTYDASVESISILLFYQYVNPAWSEARKCAAISFVESEGSRLNLGGRVRVAREGLNSTVTGPRDALRAFAAALGEFDPNFKTTDFKYIDDMPLDRAFSDLKVLPVKELVFYGLGMEMGLDDLGGGVHLEPKAYHEKLARAGSDTVVVDVRNAYESDIGRFDGQKTVGGAELLDPGMRKSTDFVPWLSKPEVREKLKGKEVLMYCTGGVRCERASAYLKKEIGDEIKGVYQLQGGVEKYLQEFQDGGFWRGKNFVFDKREAFGVECLQGVGGVLQTKKKSKKGAAAESAEEGSVVLSKCSVCAVSWDRYIGKKKCATCQVPVLVCEKCCTAKADRPAAAPPERAASTAAVSASASAAGGAAGGGGGDGWLGARCPLCVGQGLTVPATELSLTDNGKRAKLASKSEAKSGAKKAHGAKDAAAQGGQGGQGRPEVAGAKAATTVCKWGAGSDRKAKKKQGVDRKRPWDKPKSDSGGGEDGSAAKKRARLSGVPCRFGADCKRADCYFRH